MLMPSFLDMLDGIWEQGLQDQIPLSQGAMRRRSEFEGVDDAFERFRSKRLFSDWSDEVLRFYVEHGTQPKSDGNEVELSWAPAWEAYYFSTVHRVWDDLSKADGLLPMLVVRGGTSDTLVPEAFDLFKETVPSATYAEVDGHGHLFPQSAPDESAQVIHKWLT